MMDSGELNDLTRRLYAQGFTWETPCGLLIEGQSDAGRSLANSDCFYQHVWYCPENDNPLLKCPYNRKGCEHIPQGLKLLMCPCHQTQKPYDYGHSVEKVEAEKHKEIHKQYMELTGGAHCACVVGSNGYGGNWYEVKYDVAMCIQCQCKNPVCVIRKKPRDLKKVNIFYDVRRTWITRKGFLEEKKVEVTKGLKVFSRPVARTDAEIWLKVKEANQNPLTSHDLLHGSSIIEQPKITPDDRRQAHFSKTYRQYNEYDYFEFHYDVENIRIARSEQRDRLQDHRDEAEGIEVVDNSDQIKARAEKKASCQAAPQGIEGTQGAKGGPAAASDRRTVFAVRGRQAVPHVGGWTGHCMTSAASGNRMPRHFREDGWISSRPPSLSKSALPGECPGRAQNI